MTTRDKLIELIEKPIKEWLEQTGSIPKGTTYYAELMGCVQDSADALIKSGLIVDETVHSPIVLLEKDMGILDFICPKCNKLVSMVELSTIGNPCIDPQPKIEEVKKLSQVHYKYCMYCGSKLKE